MLNESHRICKKIPKKRDAKSPPHNSKLLINFDFKKLLMSNAKKNGVSVIKKGYLAAKIKNKSHIY